MVSALASSSVTFPRRVSVKVLVSDWDLLHGKEDKWRMLLEVSLGSVNRIQHIIFQLLTWVRETM